MSTERYSIPWPRAIASRLWERVCRDSLVRNSVFMIVRYYGVDAIGFVYWVLAARLYSAQDVGLVSALVEAMTLAAIVSNLGIGSTLIQVLPRRTSDETWSLAVNAGLATALVAGVLGGCVTAIMLPLLSVQFAILLDQPVYALLMVLGVPLWTVASVLDQTFVAERQAGKSAVRNLFFAGVKIPLLVLPVLVLRAGALSIFASWILGAGASLVLAAFVLVPRLRHAYRPRLRGIRGQVREMLSSLVGHHLINLGATFPAFVLPLLVTARLSATENAYFFAAFQVGGVFGLLAPAVAGALFAEGAHKAEDIFAQARASALIICALMLPAMLVVLLGGRLILSVFGPAYAANGVLLLVVLVAAAAPEAATSIYISVLRVQGQLRRAACLNIGVGLLTLVLAWVLMPTLGIAGVGWGCLVADLVGVLAVLALALNPRLTPTPMRASERDAVGDQVAS